MKLKRLLAPSFWKVKKKHAYWVVCPRAGPHPKFECIPLAIIVRDILKLAETGREAKKIIKMGEIYVDGRVRRDHAYPAGLFDVISIPRIGKNYRIVPTRKGLELVEIEEREANLKICRINNKTTVKGGKVQLNLHDGRNILVDKDIYKTGDSLVIELPTQKIVKHLPLKVGCLVLAIKGRNSGKLIKVEEIKEGKFKQPAKIIGKSKEERIELLKSYSCVVGYEKPVIRVTP